MEDILASIRQIIAEGDDQTPAPAKPSSRPAAVRPAAKEPEPVRHVEPAEDAAADDEDDVFDLTDEMVAAPASPSNAIPFPRPAAAGANDPYAEALGEFDQESGAAEFEPEPDLDVEFRTPEPRAEEEESSLTEAVMATAASGQAAERPQPQMYDGEDPLLSAAAGQAVAEAFGRLTRRSSVPADSRTIEELVVDMLRPMLKDWLDDNLPMLVERLVRDEIERVTRGRR